LLIAGFSAGALIKFSYALFGNCLKFLRCHLSSCRRALRSRLHSNNGLLVSQRYDLVVGIWINARGYPKFERPKNACVSWAVEFGGAQRAEPEEGPQGPDAADIRC